MQHRAAVLAIAEALMVKKILNSERIDAIIAAARERVRQVELAKVLKNSTGFATMFRWLHPDF
jgi:hypothetical protein